MERWLFRVGVSAQEKILIKRLTRVRTLFAFFRLHRHELAIRIRKGVAAERRISIQDAE
jgi:hypothetical protein